MSYQYSAITRVLLIQHNGRVKSYRNINLYGIEDCIKEKRICWSDVAS